MAGKVQALQGWCRHVTNGYRDVQVNNMTSAWKDGLAFCAIIHRYRPDLIDFDSLSKENILENNKLAFSVAERELSIPALLDAEDMVNMRVPDKLCVVTYVSQYYNYFQDKQPAGGPGVKAKQAAKRERPKMVDDSPNPFIGAASKETEVESGPPAKRNTLGDICCVCGKKVYIMERMIEGTRLYHRRCMREQQRSQRSPKSSTSSMESLKTSLESSLTDISKDDRNGIDRGRNKTNAITKSVDNHLNNNKNAIDRGRDEESVIERGKENRQPEKRKQNVKDSPFLSGEASIIKTVAEQHSAAKKPFLASLKKEEKVGLPWVKPAGPAKKTQLSSLNSSPAPYRSDFTAGMQKGSPRPVEIPKSLFHRPFMPKPTASYEESDSEESVRSSSSSSSSNASKSSIKGLKTVETKATPINSFKPISTRNNQFENGRGSPGVWGNSNAAVTSEFHKYEPKSAISSSQTKADPQLLGTYHEKKQPATTVGYKFSGPKSETSVLHGLLGNLANIRAVTKEADSSGSSVSLVSHSHGQNKVSVSGVNAHNTGAPRWNNREPSKDSKATSPVRSSRGVIKDSSHSTTTTTVSMRTIPSGLNTDRGWKSSVTHNESKTTVIHQDEPEDDRAGKITYATQNLVKSFFKKSEFDAPESRTESVSELSNRDKVESKYSVINKRVTVSSDEGSQSPRSPSPPPLPASKPPPRGEAAVSSTTGKANSGFGKADAESNKPDVNDMKDRKGGRFGQNGASDTGAVVDTGRRLGRVGDRTKDVFDSKTSVNFTSSAMSSRFDMKGKDVKSNRVGGLDRLGKTKETGYSSKTSSVSSVNSVSSRYDGDWDRTKGPKSPRLGMKDRSKNFKSPDSVSNKPTQKEESPRSRFELKGKSVSDTNEKKSKLTVADRFSRQNLDGEKSKLDNKSSDTCVKVEDSGASKFGSKKADVRNKELSPKREKNNNSNLQNSRERIDHFTLGKDQKSEDRQKNANEDDSSGRVSTITFNEVVVSDRPPGRLLSQAFRDMSEDTSLNTEGDSPTRNRSLSECHPPAPALTSILKPSSTDDLPTAAATAGRQPRSKSVPRSILKSRSEERLSPERQQPKSILKYGSHDDVMDECTASAEPRSILKKSHEDLGVEAKSILKKSSEDVRGTDSRPVTPVRSILKNAGGGNEDDDMDTEEQEPRSILKKSHEDLNSAGSGHNPERRITPPKPILKSHHDDMDHTETHTKHGILKCLGVAEPDREVQFDVSAYRPAHSSGRRSILKSHEEPVAGRSCGAGRRRGSLDSILKPTQEPVAGCAAAPKSILKSRPVVSPPPASNGSPSSSVASLPGAESASINNTFSAFTINDSIALLNKLDDVVTGDAAVSEDAAVSPPSQDVGSRPQPAPTERLTPRPQKPSWQIEMEARQGKRQKEAKKHMPQQPTQTGKTEWQVEAEKRAAARGGKYADPEFQGPAGLVSAAGITRGFNVDGRRSRSPHSLLDGGERPGDGRRRARSKSPHNFLEDRNWSSPEASPAVSRRSPASGSPVVRRREYYRKNSAPGDVGSMRLAASNTQVGDVRVKQGGRKLSPAGGHASHREEVEEAELFGSPKAAKKVTIQDSPKSAKKSSKGGVFSGKDVFSALFKRTPSPAKRSPSPPKRSPPPAGPRTDSSEDDLEVLNKVLLNEGKSKPASDDDIFGRTDVCLSGRKVNRSAAFKVSPGSSPMSSPPGARHAPHKPSPLTSPDTSPRGLSVVVSGQSGSSYRSHNKNRADLDESGSQSDSFSDSQSPRQMPKPTAKSPPPGLNRQYETLPCEKKQTQAPPKPKRASTIEKTEWQLEAERRIQARKGEYLDPEKHPGGPEAAGKRKIVPDRPFKFDDMAGRSSSEQTSSPETPTAPPRSRHRHKVAWIQARPLPSPPQTQPKRKVNAEQRLTTEDIMIQLNKLDQQLLTLESQGRDLEEKIRSETDEAMDGDNMVEWFALINEKNSLVRLETDLMYRQKQQELEDLHEELEYELRTLMAKPEHEKTASDKVREDSLLQELLDTVGLRNHIVDSMEEDRQRYIQEDADIENVMAARAFSSPPKDSGKKKKKKKQKRKKSRKSDSKQELDEWHAGSTDGTSIFYCQVP